MMHPEFHIQWELKNNDSWFGKLNKNFIHPKINGGNMKAILQKLFFISILSTLLLLSENIYSQTKPIRFGVRGGWNYSFTNVEIVGLNVQGRQGLNAGGVFEYWISDLFAVHANVLYNMKGNKWERDLGLAMIKYEWAFDYLSIPVLAKFAFGDKVKFYLVAGPEFSFLLSGKENTETEILGEQDTEERDLKEYMSSFELAGNFGFGVDIQVDPVVIFIDIRGSLGFTDIFKETPPDVQVEEGSVVHLVPSASIGVLYQLGE
jgi:hypothetical protein